MEKKFVEGQKGDDITPFDGTDTVASDLFSFFSMNRGTFVSVFDKISRILILIQWFREANLLQIRRILSTGYRYLGNYTKKQIPKG